MGAGKDNSKELCARALKGAESDLIRQPSVVGLGIVRDQSSGGHQVAVYVSKIEKGASLPESLPVPDSEQRVRTKIIEIGTVQKE